MAHPLLHLMYDDIDSTFHTIKIKRKFLTFLKNIPIQVKLIRFFSVQPWLKIDDNRGSGGDAVGRYRHQRPADRIQPWQILFSIKCII